MADESKRLRQAEMIEATRSQAGPYEGLSSTNLRNIAVVKINQSLLQQFFPSFYLLPPINST